MPLTITSPYDRGLPGLAPQLAHILSRSVPPIDLPGKSVHLIGPIPVFSANAADIARGRTRKTTRLGWRSLILDSTDKPIACLDVTERPGAPPGYGVDGPVSAGALNDALAAAENFAMTTPHRYEVRLLRLDRMLLAGLWLQGRHTRIILTRDGVAAPPQPVLHARSEFIHLVESRISNGISA